MKLGNEKTTMGLGSFQRFLLVYVFLALGCSFVPVLLLVLPLILLKTQGWAEAHTVRWQKWGIVWIHGGLCLVSVFLPQPSFVKAFGVELHLILAVFYGFYFGSLGREPSNQVVGLFLCFAVCCFGLVWAGVGLDVWVLGGSVERSLVDVLVVQGEGFRKALLDNRISPYQVPENIRLLLEQGASVWAKSLVGGIPLALFGVLVVVFFAYWNVFDVKLHKKRQHIVHYFRLPDWTFVVVTLWLTLLVLGLGLERLYPASEHGAPALSSILKPLGMVGLLGSLWWYALEGGSVLLRSLGAVRRFWIYFLLTISFFFFTQMAIAGLMGIGLIAQIRRFVPQKKS